MATSAALGEWAGENERPNESLNVPDKAFCSRCAGLMVQDFCTDLLNSTGEIDCMIARCVQCGDVVDPVIQRNRHLQESAGTVRESKARV